VIGRFIFGLGGESLTVAQNSFTARWFEGKQLAFAFGLVVAFSRIGTSVNFLVTPYFTAMGVPFSVWFGTEMCLLSFLAVGFVGLLDWYGEAAVQRRKERLGEMGAEPEVSLSQVRFFPLQSWLIFFNCLFFYISVLTFYTVASIILQEIAGYDAVTATNFIAIPNFVAIFASPTFGYILDRTGRSLIWMGVAGCMQVLGHLSVLAIALKWFTIPPVAIMLWIGVGYSMYASAIWPTLPFVIKGEMLGTGYGTMTAVQNAGLAIFPSVIGQLMKVTEPPTKYVIPIIIFISCAGISVVLTVILFIVDKARTGGVLNATGEVKQAYKTKLNSPELSEPQGWQ
jgi:nitrate/nitrite transporter NarK